MKHPDRIFLAYDFTMVNTDEMSSVYPFPYISRYAITIELGKCVELLESINTDNLSDDDKESIEDILSYLGLDDE